MKTPNWAIQLIELVLSDHKHDKTPKLVWRRKHERKIKWGDKMLKIKGSKPKCSSGSCDLKEITINAGKIKKDQKLVLLHELAHWMLPSGEHHGKAFWDLAFELYRKYKIPMYYALNREKNYRQEAKFAYRRNRKLNKEETKKVFQEEINA